MIPNDLRRRPVVLTGATLFRAAAATLALAMLSPASCVRRIPELSPRLDNTADHRSARRTADCLACHGGVELPPDHSPADLCFKCHKITPGVSR